MFNLINGELNDVVKNGFNFYRLNNPYSAGFKFVWGNAEEGQHVFVFRYSKQRKKFNINKFQCASRDAQEAFFKY